MEIFWRITLLSRLTMSPANALGGSTVGPGETGEVRRFRSQKVATLLVYLALHVGKECSRDVLCEILWPDGDPLETRNRLRVTLASLRKQLEPPGVAKGAILDVDVSNTVRLRPESVWIDVVAFETALRNGDIDTAQALFTGELLPTFYEDWILEKRDRINLLAQRLLEIQTGPKVLIPPTEKKADDTPRPHLPVYLTRFFGREEERERIRGILTEGACRLITLTGTGGQGKTRLAVEVAREQRSRLVWFVALADLWEGDRLSETIRDAIGLARTTTPAFTQVVSFLQTHPKPLLLLDNLEQIAPAAAPVLSALLEQVPELTILATSRVRLEIPGEQEVPVYPLSVLPSVPSRIDLVASIQLPAVALFVDRAQSARPDFQLTERNASDILGICQLLEGIPLGLELAAARSASLTPSQMRARLHDHWNALPAVGKTEKTDRHRSLRAAIEWSVALLPPDQRQLFKQLSVFQGGATLEAIEAVCEAPHTVDTLTRLRASSLVLMTEHGGSFRYSLLEVLRQWAAEQQTISEATVLAERHAAWFYRLADARKDLFAHMSGVTALEDMEAEVANFRAALAHCQTANHRLYTDLALALTPFWEHKSYLQEAQKWLEGVLPVLPDTEDSEKEKRTCVLISLGRIVGRQGDSDTALAWLREAHDSTAPLGKADQAAIHWAQGRAFWMKGALSDALTQFHSGKRLYEELNDPIGLASTLSNIGVVLRDLGDYEGARTAFSEAIQWAREYDIPRTLATVLDNFASLRHVLGEEGVREFYNESLDLKRKLRMPDGVAITLSNLATLHCRQGDWEEGRRLTEEVCILLRATGNRRGLAIAINRLGQIADAEGKHDEATSHFIESLTLRLAVGNPHDIIIALITFSEHALSRKDMYKAAQILGAVHTYLEEWGTPLPVDEAAEYQQHYAAVQADLLPAQFQKAFRTGASWTRAELPRRLQR